MKATHVVCRCPNFPGFWILKLDKPLVKRRDGLFEADGGFPYHTRDVIALLAEEEALSLQKRIDWMKEHLRSEEERMISDAFADMRRAERDSFRKGKTL